MVGLRGFAGANRASRRQTCVTKEMPETMTSTDTPTTANDDTSNTAPARQQHRAGEARANRADAWENFPNE